MTQLATAAVNDAVKAKRPAAATMGAQNSTALDSSDAAADLLTTVLRHATWKERAAALAVCRAWRNRLLQDDFYYKWLCERLHAEHLLYVPTDSAYHRAGWRALFLALWPRRRTWSAPDDGDDGAAAEQRFAISVSARFRPSAPSKEDAPPEDGAAVVVPIHQRLKLLRAQHNCSQREAMKLLMAEERKSKKGKGGGGGGEKTGGGGGGFVFEEVKFGRLYDGATDRTAEHEAAAAAALAKFGPTAEEAARNAKLKPFLYGGGAMRAEEAARERKRRLAERRVEVELRVNWPKVAGNGRVMLCMFARPPPAAVEEEEAAPAAAAPPAPAPAEEPAARPPLRATNGKAVAIEVGKAAAVAPQPPPSEAPAPSDDAAAAAAAATVASILSVKEGSGEVLTMAPGVGLRPFRFERTFDKEASQQAVYEQAARGAVVDLINGVNGCVLVYGQTGAGKTYTMFGEPPEKSDVRLPTRLGVVGRVVAEVLGALDARSPEIQSTLSIAYVEVYGSGVYDLLQGGQAVGNVHPSGRVDFVNAHRWVSEGRTAVAVASLGEALDLLRAGDACKRKAATAMNERSSRAHTLFILTLEQQRTVYDPGTDNDGNPVVYAAVQRQLRSRLFLADLGGSERLKNTRTHDGFKAKAIQIGDDETSRVSWDQYYASRGRLTESVYINQGLYALQVTRRHCHRRLLHHRLLRLTSSTSLRCSAASRR